MFSHLNFFSYFSQGKNREESQRAPSGQFSSNTMTRFRAALRTPRAAYIQELHDVFVLETLQDFDFS